MTTHGECRASDDRNLAFLLSSGGGAKIGRRSGTRGGASLEGDAAPIREDP
jgi:hypothetical protein